MRQVLRMLPSILLIPLLFTSQIGLGQAPEGVNYQAVARDGSGNILANENLTVRMSIKEGGPAGTTVFQETHNTSTNDFGLFDLIVGQGSVVTGTFSNISWGANSHFLQVEVDDGSGYVNLGTSQFVSVPYALYAKEAGNAGTSYNAGNGIDISGNTISNTGDTDATDDITTSSSAGGDVNGTFNNLNVVGIQGRSVAGSAPSSGQVLKWDGSQWAPANDNGGGGGSYSAGTGINITGANVIENTAPDQVVNLNGSGATTVSGTYPNFTISSTDNNTTYSAGTGLNLSGTQFNAQTDAAIWNANEIHGIAVAKTSPNTGEVLKYDGSQWVPSTDATGGGGSSVWTENTGNAYYEGDVYTGAQGSSDGPTEFVNIRAQNETWYMGVVNDASAANSDFYIGKSNTDGTFHIENDGNVGIGTTSPDNKLTVDGDANVTGMVGINETNPSAPLHITLTGTSIDDGIQMRSSQGTSEDWYFYMSASENLIIRDDNSDVLTFENNTDNIGIGTSTPNNQLTVSGNADFGGSVGIGVSNPSHSLHVEGGKAMIGSPNGVIAKLTVNSSTTGEDIFRARKNGNTQLLINEDGNIEFFGDSMSYDMDIDDDLVIRHDGADPQIMAYGNFSTNGKIGTSSSPFFRIYSNSFYANSSSNYQTFSDSKIKENVKSLNDPLHKISQIKGVSYDIKQEHFMRNGQPRNENERFNQIGLIAQDVEKVFPQLVQTNQKTGLKTVGYMGLIPVLVEGIKQQQSEIDNLQQDNQQLQTELDDLKKRVEQLEN